MNTTLNAFIREGCGRSISSSARTHGDDGLATDLNEINFMHRATPLSSDAFCVNNEEYVLFCLVDRGTKEQISALNLHQCAQRVLLM